MYNAPLVKHEATVAHHRDHSLIVTSQGGTHLGRHAPFLCTRLLGDREVVRRADPRGEGVESVPKLDWFLGGAGVSICRRRCLVRSHATLRPDEAVIQRSARQC